MNDEMPRLASDASDPNEMIEFDTTSNCDNEKHWRMKILKKRQSRSEVKSQCRPRHLR